MAAMSHAALDTWFKTNARDQLRTFDKTFNVSVSVYRQSNQNDAGTYTHSHNQRWHLTGASETVFNNDLNSGIGSGQVAESQDVAASIANAVRSAVDAIEGQMANFSIDARICHNSCHSSCHGSRGRR